MKNNLMRMIMNVSRTGAVNTKKSEDNKSADISIYGIITNDKFWETDVTPLDVQKAIDAAGPVEQINFYINSPGGDAFAGIAISNIIKRAKQKTVAYVDGWAASAGSVILQGADERVVYPGSIVMIHKAWTIAIGDANELMDAAEKLETVDASLVDIYKQRAKVDEEEIKDMMAAETWMSATEAIEMGFADKKEDGKTVTTESTANGYTINGQTISKEIFNNLPDEKLMKASDDAPAPEPEPDKNGPEHNISAEEMTAIKQRCRMQTLIIGGSKDE